MIAGRSSGPRYGAVASLHDGPQAKRSDDSWRRPAARRLVHRAPGLEELEKLLPGLLLLPTTVLADDFKEVVDGAFAIALGIEEEGEVEARLHVGGIGGDPALRATAGRRAPRSAPRDRSGRAPPRRAASLLADSGSISSVWRARSSLAAGEQAPGEPGDGGDRFGLGLERRGEALAGAGDVAGGKQRLALGDERLGVGGAGRAGDAVDEGLDLALGQGADEAVDRLAVDEGDDRRDRLDAELAGDRGVLVDVHLDQADGALGGA